jgi:uncharacterized RDD family membrane protein YckC
MNDQILDSPINQTRELNYAGFWIRAAALIIDGLVVGFAASILIGLSFVLAIADQGSTGSVIIVVLCYAAAIIGSVLYYVLMESSVKQGTLGKLAMGIKVGKEDGQRISGLNALGRLLARSLSSMILYIGYIMVAFDSRKQSLHDKLANTYVFYAK